MRWRFLLILAILAACSSPNPNLYTIAVAPGTQHTSGPKLVSVRQVGLARYLERSQIVRSSENYRLDVSGNDWWGEPLGAMMGRVLNEELSQRLPQSTVVSDAGAISAGSPDAIVEVDIQRMDMDSAGNLILGAQYSVESKRGSPILRNVRLSVPVSGASTGAEVAAVSTAIGQLADAIADTLAAVPSAAAPGRRQTRQ